MRQSTEECSPLNELAECLESAWNETPVNLERYLPPPGSPARLPLLHDLVQRSLHIAWFRGHPRMLGDYLSRFPELGAEQDQPAALVFAEYRFRLLANLPVTLDEYRRRFPEQFPEVIRLIAADADASTELTGTLCAPTTVTPPERGTFSPAEVRPPARAAAGQQPVAEVRPPARTAMGKHQKDQTDEFNPQGGTLHHDRPVAAPAPSTAEAPFPSFGPGTHPHTIAGAPQPTSAFEPCAPQRLASIASK